MCWVLHIPKASVDKLPSWPSWGLKKWVFTCFLQRHWLWMPLSPNASDSLCAGGRWCSAVEPWGWSCHSDWHVQPDTCLNSHVRTLGWPTVCKLIGVLCKTWLLIKRVMATADPIDGSPPGSPVPGILQARTLEWVAISFSSAWKWKVKVKSVSHVWLLATPWTAAHQASPSMGFSRQEYWSGELRLNTIPFLKCAFN